MGQRALTATLKNAIESGRLAQAYLFCGPRGVGKTSCARIFAKTINCLSPTAEGEACGECESCRAIDQGNSFNLVELDAASNNSVNDIRSITEQVNVPPQVGKYRVFIIDEVHMLSNAAFNAFLKTLEEPPSYVVFILATTEKHKVIPTILSRCQIYDFKRITVNDMVEHLEYVASQEGIRTDRDALGVIALKADGAMRDALSIFDQVSASTRGEVTYANTISNLNVLDYDCYFRLVEAFRAGDVPAALMIYKEVRDKGFDSLFFVNGLAAHVRDLMVVYDPRTKSLLETSDEIAARYAEQSREFPVDWYYAAMRLLAECDLNYRTATGKRLLVELTLIRLCQLLSPPQPPFDSLDRRVPLGDPTVERKAARAPAPADGAHGMDAGGAPATGGVGADGQDAAGQSNVGAEPASTVPERSRAGRTVLNRPRSFRLSDASHDESKGGNALEEKSEPVGDEGFMQAWQQFIAHNPSLHILVNAMRGVTPQREDGTTWRIGVGHPAQLQAYESAMPKLVGHLRETLRNDHIKLRVEVDESLAAPAQLPSREFITKAAEGNQPLAAFLSEINAELIG